MNDHPEWLGLMRAAIESPADDTPRLIAADWLEDNGRAERADFIRIQVEEARLHTCGCAPSLFVRPRCPVCALVKPLRRAGHKLLLGMTDAFRPAVEYSWAVLGRMPDGDSPGSYVRRGFVEAVRCSLAMWLAHGRAVAAAHPVEKVVLTDKRPRDVRPVRWTLYWGMKSTSIGEIGGAGDPHDWIPDEIARPLSRIAPPYWQWPTREAAEAMLSRACVAWARGEEP